MCYHFSPRFTIGRTMANRGYVGIAAGGMRRTEQGVGYINKGWFFSRLMHATKGTSYNEAPLSRFRPCGRSPEAWPFGPKAPGAHRGLRDEELDSSGMRCGGGDKAQIRAVCTADDYAGHGPTDRFVRFSDRDRMVILRVSGDLGGTRWGVDSVGLQNKVVISERGSALIAYCRGLTGSDGIAFGTFCTDSVQSARPES
jgi:hypothetical protein